MPQTEFAIMSPPTFPPETQVSVKGRDRVIRILSYAVLSGGLFTVLVCAWFVFRCHSPAPYRDQWEFVQQLATRNGHYSLGLLWTQHNEHRQVVPKLFYLVDLYIFRETNVFLLTIIYLIQLFHLGALAWLYRRLGGLSGPSWRTAVGITALCLFSLKQGENFIYGIDLCMLFPCAAATVGAGALVIYARDRHLGRRLGLVVALVAAMAGSLSLASGLLLWPMLAFTAWMLRLPRRVLAIPCACGAVIIPLFFIGYHASPLPPTVSPSVLAPYILLYFGNSWSAVSLNLGRVLAFAGILGAVVLCIRGLLRKESDGFEIFLTSVLGFVLATSGITAIGRAALGIEQAHASRYQTAVLYFWCILLVFLVWKMQTREWRVGLLAIQTVAILMLLLIAPTISALADDSRAQANQMGEASAALLAGVRDDQALFILNGPGHKSSDAMLLGDFLRAHEWSVYAGSPERSLGRDFGRFYRPAPASECLGGVDSAQTIADNRWGGIRFSGWAFDKQGEAPATKVVLVGQNGRVIGVARGGFFRPDVPAAIPEVRTRQTGFWGYVPDDLKQSEARSFAVLSDRVSACPLGGGALVRLETNPIQAETTQAAAVGTGAGDNLTRGQDPPRCSLDEVGGQNDVWRKKSLHFSSGVPDIRVSGWALDRDSLTRAAGVDLVLDGGAPMAAEYGIERGDVAQYFHCPECLHSGFVYRLPLGKLKKGVHRLTVRVISADRRVYWETQSLEIVLE